MNRFYSIVIALTIVGISLSFVTFGPATEKGLRIGEKVTNEKCVPNAGKYAFVSCLLFNLSSFLVDADAPAKSLNPLLKFLYLFIRYHRCSLNHANINIIYTRSIPA